MPEVTTPPASAPAAAATDTPPSPPRNEDTSVSFDAEIDADLAALDDEKPQAPPPKPKPEPPPPKKEEKKPAEKAVEKPDEEPPKTTSELPVKPTKAADLRNAYEGLKQKVETEFKPQIVQLQAKVKELEGRKPEDTSPLQEKLKAAETRRDELEREIEFVNFQKSAKFQTDYAKPYQEAWDRAIADFAQLTVTGEGDTTRPATAQDLLSLANMPLSEMDEAAEAMFGRSAARVIRHVERVRELAEKQNKAIGDAQKNSGEHAKQTREQIATQQQGRLRVWQASNEELAKKYPNWFAPKDGDAEGNKRLSQGFALADLVFVGPKGMAQEQIDLLPASFKESIKNGGLKPDDLVRLHALLRNKVASHDRLALRLKNLGARVKELEGELKQYHDSEPPAGRGGSGTRTGATTDLVSEANAELDALDAKNR